jgi:ADP-heptose:LPS heptosyltransferase
MEVSPENIEIRKVLIKCPPLITDAFSTFPFLIALSEEFPKAEIFLVCEKGCSFAYQFLPFKLRAFERPIDKMSLVQTHHFCANLNDIFNIDLFFDLENSFNSSFMGFNFRARERVGYGVGWNKYFLTKNFMPLENGALDLESKCLNLLELYTGKKLSELKISRSKISGQKIEKIDQLFQEPEPPKFILIMLDNFQNVSKQIAMWTKFFDSFQNTKFIIWSQDDEDLISELFFKVDLGANSLYMHRGDNSKELIYLLNQVVGVIANNVWSEGLCTYFGVNSVTLYNGNNNEITNKILYQHFTFKPQRFFIPESGPILYSYLDEKKELNEMNEIVDHIHFQFKL